MGSVDEDAALARLVASLGTEGSTRSPVFRWLYEHHDEFRDVLRVHRPTWAAVAAWLGDEGVLDGEGKPPAPGTVRNAWWRVRRVVADERRGNGVVPGLRSAVSGDAAGNVAGPVPPVDDGDPLARLRSKVNKLSGRDG